MAKTILTLDLGNTVLTGGLWEDGTLSQRWAFPVSGPHFTRRLKRRLLELSEGRKIETAILASVVPARSESVRSLCRSILKTSCHPLSSRTPTGLKILYHRPEEVGADRIANAVGAYRLFGGPSIVVDFGTAITFDVISEDFEYLGGVIAPGLEISTRALFRKAALLPKVEIALPGEVLGRDTVTAIRSGVFWGTLGLTERIIKGLKKELGWGKETKLIATGGQAGLLFSRSRLIKLIEPDLTLKGLHLIAQKL